MPAENGDLTGGCNCFALRSAPRHVRQLYDQYLAPFGLRVTQFSLLTKLTHKGPLTLNALAKSMVMDRTTLARNIQRLERDGLIAIEKSSTDRRVKMLRLTQAGEKRMQAARYAWSRVQDRFEPSFGSDRSADMQALTRVVVQNLLTSEDSSVEH